MCWTVIVNGLERSLDNKKLWKTEFQTMIFFVSRISTVILSVTSFQHIYKTNIDCYRIQRSDTSL